MDEQRAWVKSRRKKRLRILAAALAFCLLFTTYPNILETLSVFAAGTQSGDGTEYVTGFAGLPEEVREQTVPVGTGTEELMLPDMLEATVAIPEGEVLPEDAEEETGAPPESAEEETEAPPEGTEEETESSETEGTETEESADNTQPEEEADGENAVPDHGDDQTEKSQGTEPEASEEAGDTESEEGQDTEPEETAAEAVATEEAAMQDNSDNAVDSGESAPSVQTEQTEDAELTQETNTVTMPEYQAENVITAETLENTQETVTIEDITWQSEPAYDGNTEGTYIFTAVLPEGYALMEGVSLPQITVTVQADSADSVIQALLERIAALPDVAEYLAGEPETEAGEEAYAEWMGGLYGYAEEALAIQEACDALTEEQKAQIPEEAFTKLAAWVELAETAGESAQVMAVPADAEHNHATALTSGLASGNSELTGGNYYLEGPVTLTSTLKIKGNVSLCLNGQTITYSGTTGSIIEVESGANFHLYDCSSGGTGTLTSSSTQIVEYGGGVCVQQGGIFTMHGGTITGCEATYGGGVINSGTFTMSGGTISGNTATNGNGGGVYVNSGTFTMNGGTIGDTTSDGTTPSNIAKYGGGVYVKSGGTFTMNGGTISGNKATGTDFGGGGVYVNGGTFTMESGTISNNTSGNSGGGVYVFSGTFNMNGGTVSGNKATAKHGGGVYVAANGTFEMSGSSTISSNTAATCGGGVYSTGTFTMNSGTISGNKATGTDFGGGGVYVYGGTFTMNSGTISGNTATNGNGGGVYVTGTFTINGTVNITGNKKSDGSANNVYLPSGKTITLGTRFNAASTVGVTTSISNLSCTGSMSITSTNSHDFSDCFLSDNTAYTVKYVSTSVALSGKHNWSGSNGSLTCSNCSTTGEGGNCGATGSESSVTWVLADGVLTISGTGDMANYSSASAAPWNKTFSKVVIKDGVTSIGSDAFNNYTGLKSITIPSSVKSIGQNTFYGCTGLTSITIPSGVTEIGPSAFYNCSNLATIEFTSTSAPSLRNSSVFGNCTSLTTIIVPCSWDKSALHTNWDSVKSKIAQNEHIWNAEGTKCINCNAVPHKHKVCSDTSCTDHSDIIWKAWDKTDSLPKTTGYYYLTKPVNVQSFTEITGNVSLCLNGKTVTSGEGGIIKVLSGANFTLCDCGNTGTLNGNNNNCWGVYVDNGGTFNMYGGTITGCKASTYGGGVFVNTGGKFNMYGGTISDNTASVDGGGVYVNTSGSFTMSGGTISGNTAKNYGGGVNVNSGTFTMSGGTISGNTAQFGGGVFVNGSQVSSSDTPTKGTFEMKGGTISGNTETYNGGGVYVGSYGAFTMNSGIIEKNTAENCGGGVFVNNVGTFTMSGGTIEKNTATNSDNSSGNGGGVYVGSYGAFTMDNGTISGNTANTQGGGVYVSGNSTFTMSGGTISGNTSTSNCGGGVFVNTVGTFNMNGGTILGNNARVGGGGVYSNGTFTMKGSSKISGNSTTSNPGGGVYVARGTFTMSGGTISGNTATTSGGGVYVCSSNSSNSTFKINGTVNITGNTAGESANNVYLENGKTITLETSFNAASTVGVTTATTPSSCDDPVAITDKYASGGFTSDNADYTIKYEASNAVKLVGGHNWGEPETTGSTKTYQCSVCNTTKTEHAHKLCNDTSCTDHSDIIWTAWDKTDSLPTTTGNYYLTKDVSASATTVLAATEIPSGNTVYLCLNGKTITYSGTANGIIKVLSGANFTLCDCGNTGTLNGNNKNWWGVYVENGGTFNMYGGTITGCKATSYNGGGVFVNGGTSDISGGTFNMYGGTISGNTASNGGGVFVDGDNTTSKPRGTFNMYGGTISNNTATNNGGGVFVNNRGTFSMSGGTIGDTTSNGTTPSNTAKYGGGVYVASSGTFNMSGDSKISSNTASEKGGGVYVEKDGTFTMDNGTISGNKATDNDNSYNESGGGVYVASSGTFTMNGGTISGNAADGGGGGVISLGTFKMSGSSKISTNTAADQGGGVYVNSSTFEMSGSSTISGNTSNVQSFGGGVYVTGSNSKFTMNGGTISENEATYANGGGVNVNSGTFTMSSGTISGNTASKNSGGVYVGGGKFEMSGGTISSNTATERGGGVYVDGGKFEMSGGTISGNNATNGNGGGVYVASNGEFTLSGGTITNNGKKIKESDTATNNGGGVFVNLDGTFTMNSGTISSNTANTQGGGVYVNTSGSFTMSGGTIGDTTSDGTTPSNTAKYGGGVYVASSGTFNMNGGTISGNKATSYGGGVCNSGSFTMSGGTISGNEAQSTTLGGGGVFVDNTGAFTMSGGTISGNTATTSGGGVYVYGSDSTFKINGTVNITENTAGESESKSANNVYLPNDKKITIGSSFDAEKTTVGVTTETTPTSCADSASVAITDKYVSGGFTSDNTAYTIAYAEGSAAKLTKEHKYKYSVSRENSYENCEGCNHRATATLTIPGNADLTYTGSEITPATITYSGNEWVGTKPTISYSANINVGNAQAKINCGNIAGNKTFEIKPKSLTAEMVTVIPNEVIGGTPTVTVQDGTALTSSDYTVNYDATTATVTVTGEGNYTGTISKKVPKKLPTGETLQSHAEIKTPSVSGTDNLYNSDITIEPKDGWTVGTDPDNLGSSLTITEETGPEGTTIPIYLKDPDGNIYQTEYTYTLDKTAPAISGSGNLTVDGGNISFTPTEGGKAYWIISDTEPTAAEVKKNGTAQEITGGTQVDLDVTAAEKGKTVYVVLEDAAGNLSDVVKTEIQAQAHSHTLEHFPAKEATETVEGNVEYWHCSVCGKNFSDEDGTNEITNVTIPATSQIPTLPEGTDFEKDCVTLPEPIGGSTGGTGGTDNLYGSDITITPKDGWEVGTDPNKLGSSVSFTEETGRDGKEVTLYLKDKDGNVYKKEFTYTLDKSAPAVDLTGINLGTGSGSKVDKQIIGKKDTVIKIPASGITDNTSDIKKVSYTATTDGGTAKSGTLTKNGDNYEIALKDIATGGDFVGTIVLTVEDSAGHSKTVTLPADGGKIIVEEHSPVVKPVAQPSTDPSIQPNDDGWYNKNFDLTVTVTDDKGTTGAAITSGGIARIEWKDGEDGEVHTVTVPTESGIVGTKEFTIPTSDGEHTYYVNVVDNAGNSSGWKEYATVKVDTQEPAFSGNPTVEGTNISFTPTEGGKAYWIVSDTEPTAEQVKQNGTVLNITSGTESSLAVPAAEKAQTVYVVLEDAAGNLSSVVKTEILAQAHTHILTKVDRVEPTETTAGNVEYWHCSGCGKLYEDEQGNTETNESEVTIRITGGGFWIVITPDGVKIVGYSGSDTAVEVPSEIDGKPVTAIGEGAFAGHTEITSVTIPASVTAIGKDAFSGCTGLTTIIIPEGLDTTGAGITDTAAKVTYTVDEDGKITITSVTPGKDNDGKEKPVTLPETIGGQKPELSDAVKADTDDGDHPDDEQPTSPSPVQPTPQPESPVQPTPQPESPVQPTPQPTDTPDNKPENEQKPEDKQKPDDTPGQGSTESAQTEGKASEPVQVTIDGGKLTMTGEPVTTGNITETSETMTTLAAGDGAVVVTVVCEEETCTAEVCDTVAVANAVLLSEQIELVNDGETIEIRVEVKDISETVSGQDKEIIESGLAEYRKEMPGLTLGMYVDISVFVRGGEGDWNAVTSTEEPIEVVIGIPEELKGDGREFYIIRSHDGEYTLLPDTDDNPDTITVSTDMFSAYALVYKQADRTEVSAPGESGTKCGLCHICPTFLGICCFIWLAVIVAVFLLIGVVIWRKRQEEVFQ